MSVLLVVMALVIVVVFFCRVVILFECRVYYDTFVLISKYGSGGVVSDWLFWCKTVFCFQSLVMSCVLSLLMLCCFVAKCYPSMPSRVRPVLSRGQMRRSRTSCEKQNMHLIPSNQGHIITVVTRL